MNTVFVYANGTVGQMVLPDDAANRPSWRIPRRVPLSVSIDTDPSSLAILPIDEYTVRGRMFDGRPVFCAAGFDVKEASQAVLVVPEDVEHGDDLARRGVERLVRHEFPHAIELDRWCGEVPLSNSERAEGLERQHLRKRSARLLVAVRI